MAQRYFLLPEGSLRPLVNALRRLLEAAGPPALPFLRDWPRDLTPRPLVARSLPVVSALDGLERFAAPETRALVQAVAALAGDLDWRQTYTSADFGERFLENYGWSEWTGKRGAFESDAIACGVLAPRPRHRISRPFARGGRTLSPPGRACLVAFRPVRLAAARAGDMDSSSLLDDPRHAHGRRASARGLCLARGRPHGAIAHRRVKSRRLTTAGRCGVLPSSGSMG